LFPVDAAGNKFARRCGMRILVTGGTGVLGRQATPLLRADGHEIEAPDPSQLDLFDAAAVRRTVDGVGAILHLATHIPPAELAGEDEAWRDNDRLRAEASRLLVDAALAGETEAYVQPSVTFFYPTESIADEETPIGQVPEHLRSALEAEEQTARVAAAGRRGVVLRFGLLDGPGTGNELPNPKYGSTLHVADAGRALVATLTLPSGIYNVCRDGERASNARFKQATGWRPER
jgi:nucleoside-diphosphate-sugar epimerase